MQTLVRSKTLGVTGYGGRGTAGAGPGRDLLYRVFSMLGILPEWFWVFLLTYP